MDFIKLDQSRKGNRYALVIQDYLTKWPEVYALPNRKAETVARCLLDLTWKHGVPYPQQNCLIPGRSSTRDCYLVRSYSTAYFWRPPTN